jgi:hypothetical protein
MSRQLEIVVLGCCAYAVAIDTTTVAMIAANKNAVIFCMLVINASFIKYYY